MKELKLSSTDCIISETDAEGFITYANETFCKFSGYSLSELEGKPQSIIRHPDMPKWAFEWLWEVIPTGKTWSGFVKNKTKNGDFYWVFATAYKTVLSNKEIRYTSVRVAPSQEEIDFYEELYKNTHDKAPEILKALNLKN